MVFGQNGCAHRVLRSISSQKRPGRPNETSKRRRDVWNFRLISAIFIFGYSLALKVLRECTVIVHTSSPDSIWRLWSRKQLLCVEAGSEEPLQFKVGTLAFIWTDCRYILKPPCCFQCDWFDSGTNGLWIMRGTKAQRRGKEVRKRGSLIRH